MKFAFLIPYPLLPLRGGGALRCYHLVRQAARHGTVHVFIPQRERDLREGAGGPDSFAPEITVHSPQDVPPPRTVFDLLPPRLGRALHYRWLRRSWEGPADASLLRWHHLLRSVLSCERFDFVVCEHLETLKAAPLVRRWAPHSRLVLDAHNVDHLLMEAECSRQGREPTPSEQRGIGRTRRLEESLATVVDGIWCCSERDRSVLSPQGLPPAWVVPNGVDDEAFAFDAAKTAPTGRRLLFCGSMKTEANRDAVDWLLGDIWPTVSPAMPGAVLEIVGAGMPEALRARAEKVAGVHVVGEVADVRPHWSGADAALVPLRIGSGTRLKILEAMAAGVPVVSTAKGAEGLECEPGRHLLQAESPADIARMVEKLFGDVGLWQTLRANGRQLVEERYSWAQVGRALEASLRALTKEGAR